MPPIKRPVIPTKDFAITQSGAKEDGDISEAIRKAIAACQDAIGGSASFIPSPCSSDQKEAAGPSPNPKANSPTPESRFVRWSGNNQCDTGYWLLAYPS